MKREKIGIVLPFKRRNPSFIEFNRKMFDEAASIRMLEHGERAKETPVDAAITIYEQLNNMYEAEKNDFDGLVVGCYLDVGVREGRELCDIPVLGTAESSLRVCLMLGNKVGILTTSPYAKRGIEANLRSYEMDEQVFVEDVGLSVEEILRGEEVKIADTIVSAVNKMIQHYDIQVLTFGSGAMYRVYELVMERLAKGGVEIPIVNSSKTSAAMLKLLIRYQLTQSRATYPKLENYEGINCKEQ